MVGGVYKPLQFEVPPGHATRALRAAPRCIPHPRLSHHPGRDGYPCIIVLLALNKEIGAMQMADAGLQPKA